MPKHCIKPALTNCRRCRMPDVWMWADVRCWHQPHYRPSVFFPVCIIMAEDDIGFNCTRFEIAPAQHMLWLNVLLPAAASICHLGNHTHIYMYLVNTWFRMPLDAPTVFIHLRISVFIILWTARCGRHHESCRFHASRGDHTPGCWNQIFPMSVHDDFKQKPLLLIEKCTHGLCRSAAAQLIFYLSPLMNFWSPRCRAAFWPRQCFIPNGGFGSTL